MKVRFIKDHPVGIVKDRIVSNTEQVCKRWIKEGYAEEIEDKPKRGRKPKNKQELKDSMNTKDA